VSGFSPEDLFGGINFEDVFGGLHFDFGGGLFDRLFERRAPSGPPRGANLEVDLVVPLETVNTGGAEKVRFTHPQTCPDCKGSGARPGTSPRQCEACKGTGQQTLRQREANVFIQRFSPCAACSGRGRIIDQPCTGCTGSGEVLREDTIEITIPPGVEEGMVLRVAGRGLPGSRPGGIPGDLYVRIYTAPDPRFKRVGADLWREETISVADAVLGASLEIPTLRQSAMVLIPPGSQPGSVLRLKGKGLPVFGEKRKGDLLLRILVRIPQRLSADEKNLYEQLRKVSSGRSS
jgi:molecular chaperone DnaJ